MRFLSNCHTHSRWCDGADDISALLEQAQALGFVSLGLSGHACQGFDPDYSMAPKAQRGYLSELRAMQRAARPGQPRLWAGLELDALADDRLRRAAYAKADYIIGSAHYLCGGGEPVAVDGDPARLKRHVDAAFAGDGLEMARAYFALETEALLRDRPQVIGTSIWCASTPQAAVCLTKTARPTAIWRWTRWSAPPHAEALWKSTPAAWRGATCPRPIPRGNCWAHGAIWADKSPSPRTATTAAC